MEALNNRIISFADKFAMERERSGIMVGFADLDNSQLKDESGFPRAIAFAAPLRPEIIKDIAKGPTPQYHAEVIQLQDELNELADLIVESIESIGYRAQALKDESRADLDGVPQTQGSWRSMKRIATRAAIGWIGKNGLVVTKHFGPAVLLSAIYTDAPVECSKETFLSRCERCMECILDCPADAISGFESTPGEEHDADIDQEACAEMCRSLSYEALGFEANVCGICIYACPYARAYVRRALKEK